MTGNILINLFRGSYVNRSGFTLLELIVVIIILGVLLTLAMPSFRGALENSYNLESDNMVRVVSESILRCRLMNGSERYRCRTDDIDYDITNLDPTSHWEYKIEYPLWKNDPDCGRVDYAVVATRNARSGGDGTRQRILVVGRNGCRIIRDVSEGGCFVATAVYGDQSLPQIATLTRFRDEVLIPNKFGRKFVDYYYRHGPGWAKAVKENDYLKKLVRIALDGAVYVIDQSMN